MSNRVLKTLGTAAAGVALLAVSASAQAAHYISKPSTWPNNQMALGYTWGSQADGIPPTTNGTIGLNQFPYRFVSAQMGQGCSDFSCASLASAIAAYEELGNTIPNLVGWDGHESERIVNLGAVMSILGIGVEDAEVDAKQEKDAMLNKMTNVSTLVNWFNSLSQIAGAITKTAHPVLILEPNVWGTILQARFHFETEACNQPYCQGKTWAQVLEFSVPLRQALQSANSPILSEVNANPDLYPENVAGLARAMVRAVRYAIPSATVFAHASTWAVYANGCSGNGATENLTNDNLREFKSTKSMVNWQAEDIQLSAMANVRFYRELFGWNDEARTRLNDNVWPHGFAIEKYGYDAGMVQNSNHYTAQSTFPMPGAGTGTFFWNQRQMDNWLTWAATLSQGSGLPLIAYGIPLGNGSMPNQPFQWQDTFVDWLFSSGNWGGQYTWSGDNWDRFKQAGFLGVLAARNGWPATGTNWGTLSSTGVATGCNSTIRGQIISCPASSSGDNMFFFNQFVAHDRNLSDIPVTFDEENFAQFSGFCRGRSEATVEVNDIGIQHKSGIYAGGSKGAVNGPVVDIKVNGNIANNGTPDNVAAIANMPEYMKTNAMWLMAKLPDDSYELIQNNPSAVEQGLVKGSTRGVNGGLVNPSNAGEIANVLSTTAGIGLELVVDLGGIEGFSSWDQANKQAGVFPVEYELYIFDNLGNFITSASGYLSETDVVNYASQDPKSGSLVLNLMVYFVPIDQKGRHIASGVYMMRGFFKEEAKTMCQKLKLDGADCVADGSVMPLGNDNAYSCPMDPNDPVLLSCAGKVMDEYGVPKSAYDLDANGNPMQANGNIANYHWRKAVVQNSVVITKKFGYMRTKAN